MKENDWTRSIKDLLVDALIEEDIKVDVLKKVPYALECLKYNNAFEPIETSELKFETDLLIYEVDGGEIKPRVIVEAKVGSVTTHDAITYSYKASCHKNVSPYLRYGIMLGNRQTYPLPGRLFRHGTNFDFLFSFKEYEPNEEEWVTFISMIKREIIYSRQIEEMLFNSRSPEREHYYMLQKKLELK